MNSKFRYQELKPSTIEQEMKNKILVDISNNLTLEDLEAVERFAIHLHGNYKSMDRVIMSRSYKQT